MALFPGTRLGPYAITAQIGVGGMGEVYRARDTKLDRGGRCPQLPSTSSRQVGGGCPRSSRIATSTESRSGVSSCRPMRRPLSRASDGVCSTAGHPHAQLFDEPRRMRGGRSPDGTAEKSEERYVDR